MRKATLDAESLALCGLHASCKSSGRYSSIAPEAPSYR